VVSKRQEAEGLSLVFGDPRNPHSSAALSEPTATMSMSLKNLRLSGPMPGCG